MAHKWFKCNKRAYNVKNNNETLETEFENADFETAIAATKFGKFNILLYIMSIPGDWASPFEIGSMAFVLAPAHCDLNLSLSDRGTLNAITFAGVVSSAFLWGYLCDTFGRKKLMVIGYFLDAFFVIMSAFSQNYKFLLVFKFLGGFVVNGPYAALTAYLSEFHGARYRSNVQLIKGMIISLGSIIQPLLSWIILPKKIDIHLFNDSITLHSWNIFLLFCAVPSLLSGILFLFMPESPKFLMAMGKNDEALEVFKQVFKMNTGLSKTQFPVKNLMNETEQDTCITANRNKIQALKEGFQQVKPLCFSPYLKNFVVICAIQCFYNLSIYTWRLWLPQMLQAVSDYEHYNNDTSDFCKMLQTLQRSEKPEETCEVNLSPSVYLNTTIIAAVTIFGSVLATAVINKLGRRILLALFSIVCGLSGMLLYFAQNIPTIVALSSIFMALGSICNSIELTIIIDLFPTSLRAVTISLELMLGRVAAIIGNLAIPELLKMGCAPAIFFTGSVVMVPAIFVFFLPSTALRALK